MLQQSLGGQSKSITHNIARACREREVKVFGCLFQPVAVCSAALPKFSLIRSFARTH